MFLLHKIYKLFVESFEYFIKIIVLKTSMMVDVNEGYNTDIRLSHMCVCTSASSSFATIAEINDFAFQSGGSVHPSVGK